MLYDPKWEKPEVKSDPFSLDSLIAWLEKQPANMSYDWNDCHGKCLIGIYMAANNIGWDASKYCSFQNYDVRVHIAGTAPFTFGAALGRAIALRDGR